MLQHFNILDIKKALIGIDVPFKDSWQSQCQNCLLDIYNTMLYCKFKFKIDFSLETHCIVRQRLFYFALIYAAIVKVDTNELEKRLCLPQPSKTKGNVLSLSVYIYSGEGHRVKARSPDRET